MYTLRGPYLRFGDEGSPRDGEAVVDGAQVLSHDGQTTPLTAVRAGGQALGHLLLEGQGELRASKDKRAGPVGDVLQPLDDERSGHAEWQVPDDVEVGRLVLPGSRDV